MADRIHCTTGAARRVIFRASTCSRSKRRTGKKGMGCPVFFHDCYLRGVSRRQADASTADGGSCANEVEAPGAGGAEVDIGTEDSDSSDNSVSSRNSNSSDSSIRSCTSQRAHECQHAAWLHVPVELGAGSLQGPFTTLDSQLCLPIERNMFLPQKVVFFADAFERWAKLCQRLNHVFRHGRNWKLLKAEYRRHNVSNCPQIMFGTKASGTPATFACTRMFMGNVK